MAHILTGAVRVSGVYRDENGVERRYTIHRGQDVASLGLPEHVVKQLLSRTRPLGGRRGAPIPYFTHVDEVDSATPVESKSVNMADLEEATHKSRVAAGVVEPEEEPVKEIPQPPVDADGGDDDPVASTPDEAAAAVAEEVVDNSVPEEAAVVEDVAEEKSEEAPVVSPVEVSEEAPCSKVDCISTPDTCEDDDCPVNEAPVEVAEVPTEVAEVPAEGVGDSVSESEQAEEKPAAPKPKKASQAKSAPKAGTKKPAKKRKPK